MSKPQTIEPVFHFRALVPDRCNFKDETFERFVDRFMEQFMPGFPLGLLDTEDHERWEIVEDDPEDMEESRYGFPWAWNWAFLPDDRITDDELHAAGFTVAHYSGGDGDEYRLCGIDGGGYSFKGAHFALLCAIVHENRSHYGWKVETNVGPAYVTTNTKNED